MKSKILWVGLIVLAVAVGLFVWLRQPATPKQSPANASPIHAPVSAAVRGHESGGSAIVIQTGQERMSNAVRCMSFVIDLANKLPKERASDKPMLQAMAGVLFFDDCLMSKMSNGFITITTNELRQSFSNAFAQTYSTNVPDKSKDGFDYALNNRNNLHISLDDQYQRMSQYPAMAKSLNQLTKAIGDAGVTDCGQSDLKEMCVSFCETGTTAYLTYGAHDPEYQAMADALDQIFQWRLTNMYGLDSASAQTLAHSVLRIPVDAFSQAGAQPPAFIQ
jgi:hypothetical protein